MSETPNTTGLNAHPARASAGYPVVKGRCPACGSRSLFLGSGGFVTCAILRCPRPDAAADVLEEDPLQALVVDRVPADNVPA